MAWFAGLSVCAACLALSVAGAPPQSAKPHPRAPVDIPGHEPPRFPPETPWWEEEARGEFVKESLRRGGDNIKEIALLTAVSDANRYVIDPVAGTFTQTPRRQPTGVGGPRGELARVEHVKSADDTWTTMLLVEPLRQAMEPASEPAAHQRRVKLDGDHVQDLQWRADGSALVFALFDASPPGVFEVDVTKPALTHRRITPDDARAWSPAVSSTGAVAHTVLRERRGKEQVEELWVIDGDARRRLVDGADITALAWNPDGTKIVYSTHGELRLIDAGTGAVERTWSYPSAIDERAYAHHAELIAWSPDGATIALRLPFSGGRSTGLAGGPPQPIFGDLEIFLVPVVGDARPMKVSLPEPVNRFRWQRGWNHAAGTRP